MKKSKTTQKKTKISLSSLKINQKGKMNGRAFRVVDRCPEDRLSGSTTIRFKDDRGRDFTFFWDHENPVVLATEKE